MDTIVVIGLGLAAAAVLYFVLSSKKSSNPSSLEKNVYKSFKLIQKNNISHNTRLFRFALPSNKHKLGLPTGQHISLMFTGDDNKPIMRSYTPVSSDDDLGYFDLVIKVYPDGKMTQHLEQMNIGDCISVKGPKGEISYKGNGNFSVHRRDPATHQRKWMQQHVKKVGMIAGGTGITPMLQIIREIVKKHPTDTTQVSLIFANVTVDDILLRDELDTIVEQYSNIKVYYTLDKPPSDWNMGNGFVTKDMISEHLPSADEDSLVLVCGPPPMVKFMEKNLVDLKFDNKQYFIY